MIAISNLTERDEQIVALRRQPGVTLESIADQFGISRERVRQIVTRAGLVYERQPARFCLRCEKEIWKTNPTGYCRACGIQVRAEARPWFTCEFCGIRFQSKQWWNKKASHRFCSTNCRDAAKKGKPLGRWKLVPYKLEGWVPSEEMPAPYRRRTFDPAISQWIEELSERQGQMIKLIVDSRQEATNITANWRNALRKTGRYGVTRTVSENGKFTVYLGAGPKVTDA